ncbi:MAG: ATP-dependent RNA helicase [Chloroflexi bacterium]|nr:ATP-dependent RNA helicase [Chloroflexota bacterium]
MLPIHDLRTQLSRIWREHNSLVLVAPTGSGKTTQAPQMLYADGLCGDKLIVVLQPRRVAARSVATRVAHEMNVTVGDLVGYQVRFDEQLGPATRIAYVTEGILLRWLQSDPLLKHVGAVMFDEFHERNLMSDVALALCRRIQTRRPDLRLIVMSATLEAEPVAHYLGCPILESAGRSFPVDVHYQEWDDDRPIWERASAEALRVLRDTGSDDPAGGDVLIFLPGMNEIQRTLDEIRSVWRGGPLTFLMLHGDLSPHEQDRVFAPSELRRVIAATNVAETSLTIPGIRHVIDSGLVRVARYDPTRGVDTLHVEAISQASADQRAGRAGRTAPGTCIRLWSQKNHAARPARNTPEVQRTELSSTVLLLHSLGVQSVADFDFLDKPDTQRITAAEALLEDLGALHAGAITEIGRRMLHIPAHPRYARMLIEAEAHNCVREIALLAALVGGRDLLMRLHPRDERDRIMRRNRASLLQRRDSGSDFFLYARSFEHAERCNFDGRKCADYGVNAHTARETAQTRAQILALCEEAGLTLAAPTAMSTAAVESIARCHLTGFVDHLAVRTSSGSSEYDLAHGRRAQLADESIAGNNMLLVASELREIGGRDGEHWMLLRFASAVQAEWVRQITPRGLSTKIEHVYDRLHKRVAAGRVLRYHDLVLAGERVDELDPEIAAAILAEEALSEPTRLPQWEKIRPLAAQMTREQMHTTLTRAFHGAATLGEALRRDVLTTLAKNRE